jgi:hypothetical protein
MRLLLILSLFLLLNLFLTIYVINIQHEEKAKRRRITQRTQHAIRIQHFHPHVYCFSAMFYCQKGSQWYIYKMQP